MATIVRDKKSQREFILIGTGFGAYHAKSPNVVFGALAPDVHKGHYPTVFVSDSHGQVGWFSARDVEVISIDGFPPAHYLQTLVEPPPPRQSTQA